MGKMIRSYSVLVLFLLMSISVFAGNGRGNGNKAWVEKVELLEGNKIKISLITRTQKYINKLVIEETNGLRVITLGRNDRENITSGKKNMYRWSINYGVKPEDRTTISFEIRKNHNKPVDGTQSIGGKEISCDISDLVPPEEVEIDIKTYEEINQVEKPKLKKDGYIFTKGGERSNISNPVIYAVVPKDKKIKKLKIETLDSIGEITGTKEMNLSKKTGNIEIESNYFNYIENGAYRVKITPISKGKNRRDIEGDPKFLNFIVDTKINALSSNPIGEIDTEGKIKVAINELSGISKYEYEFILNYGEKTTGIDGVNFESNITEQPNIFKVDISRVAGRITEIGGVLNLTVWDKLGHSENFSKSYIGEIKPVGTIISSVKEKTKQRSSRVKIINGKYSIESSIDGSSEDEITINKS